MSDDLCDSQCDTLGDRHSMPCVARRIASMRTQTEKAQAERDEALAQLELCQRGEGVEYVRGTRHHDVLLAVLVENVRVASKLVIPDEESGRVVREACVRVAREYADTAYPPPKAPT